MDNRRPVRPPQQQTSRRPLFNTAASRSKPTTTNSKTVHIASEASLQDEDLVERDPSGNYKVIGPTTAMKMGVDRGLDVDDEEKEQEDQMIALYGKQNVHWDQAAVMEEVKAALKASLARKAQSLENDRWIFEGDVRGKGL